MGKAGPDRYSVEVLLPRNDLMRAGLIEYS